MATPINVSKLVQAIADAYTVEELKGFLGDYCKTRLDHIINPVGLGLIDIARSVVDYFDRRGGLTQLIRELEKDRPDKIHLLSLLAPASPTRPSAASLPIPAPTVDIDPEEVDFYFVIEPDRRTVPAASSKRPVSSIYVRIPAVGASASSSTGPRRALALAVDRSGSMAHGKMETARAAAGYLLDLVVGATHQVSIVAFDTQVDSVVPLQSIRASAPTRAKLSGISPRGQTDLFSAWQRSVSELRTLDDRWDRRIVLITDGQLNYGMVDPMRFEREVQTLWKREKIATTCVSMGDDWNVDLLNRLAIAGGGSIHFMKDEHQAQQVLHEAFHAGRGVVAANLRFELEPLGSSRITEVQGAATSLAAGAATTHMVAGQLRTNVEEYLILRVEFPSPSAGQSVEILRSKILYDDPVTAVARATSDKVLRVYADDAVGSAAQPIVFQGVVCTAHSTLSRHLFRQALGAFLHGDGAGGQALLGKARFALETTDAPRGYQASVGLQHRRINDIERFEGHVPVEYIKEKYIEEMSHRDVVWMKLCEVFDRLLGWMQEQRIADDRETDSEMRELFRWADRMVDELAETLPVHGEFVSHNRDEMIDRERSTEPNHRFWLERATAWMARIRQQMQSGEGRDHGGLTRSQRAVVVVAGACFGFERRRQGTREELVELMEAYLHTRLGIQDGSDRRG